MHSPTWKAKSYARKDKLLRNDIEKRFICVWGGPGICSPERIPSSFRDLSEDEQLKKIELWEKIQKLEAGRESRIESSPTGANATSESAEGSSQVQLSQSGGSEAGQGFPSTAASAPSIQTGASNWRAYLLSYFGVHLG